MATEIIRLGQEMRLHKPIANRKELLGLLDASMRAIEETATDQEAKIDWSKTQFEFDYDVVDITSTQGTTYQHHLQRLVLSVDAVQEVEDE